MVRIETQRSSRADVPWETTMHTNSPARFLIGQDSRGHWIAQKEGGQCGGLFISRAAAVKFALLQNGYRPEAIITVGHLELDLGGPALAVHSGAARATPQPAAWQRKPALNRVSMPIAA
jgi:hypothetical protein